MKKIKKIKKMTENIKQTILVPANGLLSDSWINEKSLAALNLVNTSGPETLAQAKKDFFNSLSIESKTQFKTLGIETPNDLIKLNLTLGGFVFDIIVPSLVKPSAPLRLAAYHKQIGELAEKLIHSCFELTQMELDLLRGPLDDDILWSKVKIEAEVGDAENISIPLTLDGVATFDKIIQAAVKLFEPQQGIKEVEETETVETVETVEAIETVEAVETVIIAEAEKSKGVKKDKQGIATEKNKKCRQTRQKI